MRIKLDWQGKALVPIALAETKDLKPSALSLFIVFLGLREKEEDRDVPYNEIADRLNWSTARVRKCVRNLIETGWAKYDKADRVLYLRMHSPRRPRRKIDGTNMG